MTWGALTTCRIVELWDDTDFHLEELIALTAGYLVPRAAFGEVVKCRPRQKTRLLADIRRKN